MQRLSGYGWVGLAVIILVEVLLWARVRPVAIYFTPLVWTGYILFLDALVARTKGSSLLKDRPGEFAAMAFISILSWLVFEGYNLRLKTWEYVGLPDSLALRLVGYGWSFATIFPAILLTGEWCEATLFSRTGAGRRIQPGLLRGMAVAGTICLLAPWVWPSAYLIPLVWVGFFLLLDPINYRWGVPSLLRDLEKGRTGRPLGLLVGGLGCGLLWEFWNQWAEAKWIYHLPYLPNVKVFQMPILGYLGFLPFALECFVMYGFSRALLRRRFPSHMIETR